MFKYLRALKLIIGFLVITPLSADPTIYLVGDSTMANKPRLGHPERGWGQMFTAWVKAPARVENHAMNGRSTKSFIDEGRWDTVRQSLRPGDWVIIQFGHNDAKQHAPERYAAPQGDYQDNLIRMVTETLKQGAYPILATPVARRKWDEAGLNMVPTHGDYPSAMRKVADEMSVPLLEMERLTTDLEEASGVEGSKALHLWFEPGIHPAIPDGLQDNTHYSETGARQVSARVAAEIRRQVPALARWLRAAPLTLPTLSVTPDAVVALDGSGDYISIERAIYKAPQARAEPGPSEPWVILVKPGVYRERVYVQRERGNITLVGEDPATTILVHGVHANMVGNDGGKIGTFRTPTLQIDGDGFVVENMTIANDAGPVGQALALRVDGDRVVFRRCHFLGWQDTILVNRGRHYFADCYIEGDVDFIFGGANAVFDRCTLHCLDEGYITAAATPADQAHGLTFLDNRITGESSETVYLGRPWRAHAQTTFVRTHMSEAVRPEGWHNWRQPAREQTARYREFANTGPGASPAERVAWAPQLSQAEAASLHARTLLAGHDQWQIPNSLFQPTSTPTSP